MRFNFVCVELFGKQSAANQLRISKEASNGRCHLSKYLEDFLKSCTKDAKELQFCTVKKKESLN